MWYLIVSIPDLCNLTYFVALLVTDITPESDFRIIPRSDRYFNTAWQFEMFKIVGIPVDTLINVYFKIGTINFSNMQMYVVGTHWNSNICQFNK